MVMAGAVAPPRARRRRPGRSRQQRRNRRSGVFDLLAVVAALALVALGLANLQLIGATDLAGRCAKLETEARAGTPVAADAQVRAIAAAFDAARIALEHR